jgi:hypothetical protein
MAGSVLVDAGFLIALLSRRDRHHRWAAAQSPRLTPPWKTCEAVLSEAFHLLGTRGGPTTGDQEERYGPSLAQVPILTATCVSDMVMFFPPICMEMVPR